ncbi:hypothetical protein [Candidatus Nitrososphaera gargensis]|nr:hypothetical protein [Candidatus Nitrososphaera gargensis]
MVSEIEAIGWTALGFGATFLALNVAHKEKRMRRLFAGINERKQEDVLTA